MQQFCQIEFGARIIRERNGAVDCEKSLFEIPCLVQANCQNSNEARYVEIVLFRTQNPNASLSDSIPAPTLCWAMASSPRKAIPSA